jgi:hypothetical protein
MIVTEARVPALRLPGCHMPALSAEQLTARGNREPDNGFTALGEVNLVGAHIGSQLILDGATLTNPNGRALGLQQLRAGELLLRNLTRPPQLVDFTHAEVGTLIDEPGSWPRQVLLDGFVYDALHEDRPVSVH